MNSAAHSTTPAEEFDAVVIGAGFSGLYALHRLRLLGLRVVGVEAGDGVGGTWYWNRYPGARVDIESMQYSYSFDEDLQQDWRWPERFSAQPELESYANHVADRFRLRELIRFSSRVDYLRWHDGDERWQVHTENGLHLVARFVVAATGSLDATNIPDWPGIDTFEGQVHHTSTWPRKGVDLTGKRVALVGTGSTGIQIAPLLAEQAAQLFVLQRTPNFALPSHNRPMEDGYEREWKEHYTERRRAMRRSPTLGLATAPQRSVFDYSEAQRADLMEEVWNSQSGFNLLRLFADTSTDPDANEVLADFVRAKIRGIVQDPATAELLCPMTYPIGAKRLCIESGYFEMFNRCNVTLVDVRTDPVVEVLPHAVRTTRTTYEIDSLVLATGFDAMTGSLIRMNVTGRDGTRLADKWADGPTTFLGLVVAGFPNLFLVHGPGSPSVQAQMIAGGELQVEWITDTIARMLGQGHATIDTTPEWEGHWGQEVRAAAERTLFTRADSWFLGANIPGKPRVFMVYVGGFDTYLRRCREQVERGFEGFVLRGGGAAQALSR